jgi:predicted lactoylglutathione lyase
MINGIFLNLPIKNVKKSVDFFTALGFVVNPQFSGEENTCIILGENMYAMLCEENRFQKFLPKPIAEPETTEVLISLSCDSRERVNDIAQKAFTQGGRKISKPEDHGFMYSWGFEDLDGHVWDLFWMNPDHVQ